MNSSSCASSLRALEKPAALEAARASCRSASPHRRGARRRPRARRAARDRGGERGPSRRGDRLRAGAGRRGRSPFAGSPRTWRSPKAARLYGPGLDAFGLAPERLLTVAAARRRDLLWAMEEALRCRAVRRGDRRMASRRDRRGGGAAAVARGGGERRAGVAVARRAGGRSLHRRHALDRRRGAVRSAIWLVPASPRSSMRNRRGPTGSWILEWSDSDECFVLATPAQPVAAPALDRPHRKVA